ncbi:ABC transporter ATP-binding protein [Kitasatospora purpeofusca]|uniref:ABC transporter ATP-binding protein n=1 Tax=Kitasatospora purpeofusca TaxID=67352 RepID=UPI00224F485F|nr:ABC transporter ATP-binding protein [Kitasatospora purpeofusca]MCX4758990.1 ABC transporter ATP-binding protein/permease [Kitasatospora purpeofusca]WSR30591.1 ABC transporter ATP-binding protein/permease [Kitasatospora purpeofusca]
MRPFPEPDPGEPALGSPGRYLLWLASAHRASAVLAVGYGVLCTLAQAFVPAAIGRGVDRGLIAADRGALVAWCAVVLGLGVTQAVAGTLRDRCSVTNRFGASYRTMQLVTRKAAQLGAELPRRVSAGTVVSVGATDITRIGAALESTARGGGAAVSIAVVAGVMLTVSWQLGLVALVGVPLSAAAIAALMRLLHARQHRLRKEQGALADLAVDIVDGLRVLRGIGGERVFADRYRERSQRVRHEGVRVAGVESGVAAGRLLLPGLLVTVIVWLGAHFVGTGRMSPGALVAFYGYAVFLAEQLRRATSMVDQLTRALVAARMVTDLLAMEPGLGSGDRELDAEAARGPLRDPGSGLEIPPGRFVAVACARPDDMLVLADRLGRYVDSPATLGGTPLAEFPLAEVRRRILVVDHDARLFSGGLAAQLDPHGPNSSPNSSPNSGTDRLRRALDTASAHDVVEALPEGLDQEITGGREFSGGQRQRLNLVRALLADPDTLVLVEPTSALDAHTEARVAEGLGAHRHGRSTVVFTTSPILLDRADHVVLVEGGAVVAEGRHGELLADARYRAVVTREVTVA